MIGRLRLRLRRWPARRGAAPADGVPASCRLCRRRVRARESGEGGEVQLLVTLRTAAGDLTVTHPYGLDERGRMVCHEIRAGDLS